METRLPAQAGISARTARAARSLLATILGDAAAAKPPLIAAWVYWYNAVKAFEILRFSWQPAGDHQLILSVHEYAAGTWDLDGQNLTDEARAQAHRDYQITLAYTIAAGNDAGGKPVTLLSFDQPVIRGVTGDRFSLERQLADNERDPAH